MATVTNIPPINVSVESLWARVVSNVLSPPIVWTALAFWVAFATPPENQINALLWATYYSIFAALIPLFFVVFLVKRGKITDMHMPQRRERMMPFAFSIGSAGFAALSMHLLGAPIIFIIFALIAMVQLSVVALITLYWQISMHTSSIMGAVIGVVLVFGSAVAVATTPLVVLVATARLRLKRHTLAQLLAGILVGAFVPVAVLYLMVNL